jgi:methylmalonyl-CoA mutase N-terminal domain/subunit
VDPLGGSYFVEALTADLEREALGYFERIDGMGGMIPAIERGFPQREIAESAYAFQLAAERGDRIVVGVNDCVDPGPATPLPTLYIDETSGARQLARLAAVKARRHAGDVAQALDALEKAAASGTNLMPLLIDAARVYATVGETCDALRRVWGEYVETPVI